MTRRRHPAYHSGAMPDAATAIRRSMPFSRGAVRENLSGLVMVSSSINLHAILQRKNP
jgi:hypothetical protein